MDLRRIKKETLSILEEKNKEKSSGERETPPQTLIERKRGVDFPFFPGKGRGSTSL